MFQVLMHTLNELAFIHSFVLKARHGGEGCNHSTPSRKLKQGIPVSSKPAWATEQEPVARCGDRVERSGGRREGKRSREDRRHRTNLKEDPHCTTQLISMPHLSL